MGSTRKARETSSPGDGAATSHTVVDKRSWPREISALWPNRCRTLGRLVINRSSAPPEQPQPRKPYWLDRLFQSWRRKDRWTQWTVVVVGLPALALYAVPFQFISRAAYSAAVLIPIGLFGLGLWLTRVRPPPPPAPDPEGELLERLAASGQPEGQVAAAASRAWNEILAEPAWATQWTAGHRVAFDGAAEVTQIVDAAPEIMAGREAAGPQADGTAESSWHFQHAELDAAAARLGARADSLIRLRDRVDALSRAVHHLAEVQRMERSALAVDDVVVKTSFGYADHEQRMVGLADEIAGVRMGIEDLLVELNRGEPDKA